MKKINMNYTTNEQLWRIEDLAANHGYTKTNDCYWAQIFENENGDQIITSREDTASADPVADLAALLDEAEAPAETAGDFIAIIDALLKLDGLEIELCGRWLWIGGNTREHKDALKAAGCRWCSTKKLWSWHFADEGCGYRKGRRSTMDQIRSKYGSTTFSRSATSDALPA